MMYCFNFQTFAGSIIFPSFSVSSVWYFSINNLDKHLRFLILPGYR